MCVLQKPRQAPTLTEMDEEFLQVGDYVCEKLSLRCDFWSPIITGVDLWVFFGS